MCVYVFQVAHWLFAPHSKNERDYCSGATNESMVWGSRSPGHREITSQELIIQEGHILQFKVCTNKYMYSKIYDVKFNINFINLT